jgi:group I intron endonuclease
MQTEISNKPYGRIYKLTNKINGKPYIGQTIKDLDERWAEYKTLRCVRQPKLYAALNKYGPDNFTYEAIDEGTNQIELDLLETKYIRLFNSMNNGYNCNEGGNARGVITEETRTKISKATKGKKRSEETRKRISEAKQGMVGTFIGKHHSEESKQKMSIGRTGNKNHQFGVKWSDERKQKLSKLKQGVPRSEETKRKISETKLNQHLTLSEETKHKMSIAGKGRIFTKEHKNRIAESHRNGETVLCEYCKTPIYRSQYYLQKQKYHFCSCRCKGLFQGAQRTMQ